MNSEIIEFKKVKIVKAHDLESHSIVPICEQKMRLPISNHIHVNRVTSSRIRISIYYYYYFFNFYYYYYYYYYV